MAKYIRRGMILLIVIVVLIQFVPVGRPVTGGESHITVPDEVRSVLEGSCFDCHSFETKWPWYSRIAPVSWFVVHHVKEARSHVNFSEWDNTPAQRKAHLCEEIQEEVGDGEMPLKSYLLLHSGARLSESDRNVILRWASELAEGEEGESHH